MLVDSCEILTTSLLINQKCNVKGSNVHVGKSILFVNLKLTYFGKRHGTSKNNNKPHTLFIILSFIPKNLILTISTNSDLIILLLNETLY